MRPSFPPVGADAVVAAQREDQPARDRVAVHGADHRPRERVPAGEGAVDARHHVALALLVERGGELEVDARGEESRAAGEDDRVRRVFAQLLEHGGPVLQQLEVHRVRRRPVDPHESDAVPVLDGHVARHAAQ